MTDQFCNAVCVFGQIDAVMLFINSTTKKVSFSALPHLVTYTGTPVSGQSGTYRVGDIVSEAIVRKSVAHEKTQTVYFNLGIPMIGFAGVSMTLYFGFKDDVGQC